MKAKVLFALLILLSTRVAAETTPIELPSQSLNQSLATLAQLADTSIIYPFDQTRYHMAPALKGTLSVEQALGKLLQNSRFSYQAVSNDVYVIVRDDYSLLKEPTTKQTQKPKQRSISPPEEVVSIGSRRGEVALANSLVAVDVIQGDTLVSTGNLQTADAIRAAAPSFNVPTSTLSDGTDAQRPATLRGLEPDQLLVLINGKRRHQSALMHTSATVGRGTSGIDLNAIPQAAIKRVEILRDGAAAQYGADAIAGVINIVLNDHAEGGELFLHIGKHSEGDGARGSISLNNAHNWGGISRLNYAMEIKYREPTDRSQESAACFYINSCTELADGRFQTTDARELSADRTPYRLGDARLDQLAAIATFNHYQNDNTKYYFDASLSNQQTSAPGFFRAPNQSDRNPVYLFDGRPLNAGEAYIEDGFLPMIETQSTDLSLSAGQIKRIDNWYWDFNVSFGQNTFGYRVEDSINASSVSFSGTSPNSGDAGTLNKRLFTFSIDGTQTFQYGTVALGAQWRQDGYKITAGEPITYLDYDSVDGQAIGIFDAIGGIQVFPGFSPQNATNQTRDTFAAYSEAEINYHDSSISVAIRYEDIERIDQQFIQKLSIAQQVGQNVKFRASANTGFRAPSMQQQFYSDLSNQFFVVDGALGPARIITIRNDSEAASLLGVDELDAEFSVNTSIGVEGNFKQFKFSADLYRIDIKDRITISSVIPTGLNTDFDEALLSQGADLGQLFYNGADTRTEGVDFKFDWKQSLFNIDIQHNINFNHSYTRVTEKHSLGSLNNIVLSPQSESILEDWQPATKAIWRAQWQGQKLRISLSGEYIGDYTVQETDGSKQTFSAKTLFHGQGQYLLDSGFEVQLGVNNIFDVTPDKNTIGQIGAGTIIDGDGNVVVSSEGIFQFSRRTAPFGYNGRYVFLGLRYSF